MANIRSPAERDGLASLRGRIGAYSLHAQRDSRETTAAGRAAFLSRFEREVDPEGKLTPEERARRAEAAKRAYFAGLALKSVKARAAKARQTSMGSPGSRSSIKHEGG